MQTNNKAQTTYTLSKLQMYEECPQKYKLCYIDKVHIVEPISKTETGNTIHNLINYYLKGMDVTKLVESLNKNEKLLWYNFKNSDIKHYNYAASEYAFNLKLDEFWLTGRLDALFEYDGNYIIVDWKTGEKFAQENVKFQTSFYLLCVYEILKLKGLVKKPEQISLHYMNLASDSVVRIPFDEDLHWKYKTQILAIINKINENKSYFCNKTDKCKYCKYYRACPYY